MRGRVGTGRPPAHAPVEPPGPPASDDERSALGRAWRTALHIPEDVNPIELWARAAVWTGLLVLGWSYLFSDIVRSQNAPSFAHLLLSRVNLVFHEAGHIVFSPFGRFVSTLGGSLLQVLVPLICAATFLHRHANAFAASVAVWWTGQSLIDLAPYIADAREQQMILLGGITGRDAPGYHDWYYILFRLGRLSSDHTLARFAHLLGALLVVLGLVWGGYQLWGQHRATRRGGS